MQLLYIILSLELRNQYSLEHPDTDNSGLLPYPYQIQLTDIFSYINITSIAVSRHCLLRTRKPDENRLKIMHKWQKKTKKKRN